LGLRKVENRVQLAPKGLKKVSPHEEKNEDERDHELEETQGEVVEEAREEELLVLRRVPSH